MNRRIHFWSARRALICGLGLAAALGIQGIAAGEELPYASDPAPHPPQVDVRSGGVLAESHAYHHQDAVGAHAPRPNIAPADGWYGYGFPGQSYRWGWFGAERYYPRVVWHRGYYGDCCRWGYRRGY